MEFLTFTVEDHHFAIEINFVECVVLAVELIALPCAPKNVCGAVNMHGEIIPVVDMRELFGLPTREMEPTDQFVICHLQGVKTAFWVDAVRKIVECPADEMLPPEKTQSLGGCVRHVIKDQAETILVCGWEKLCQQNPVGS